MVPILRRFKEHIAEIWNYTYRAKPGGKMEDIKELAEFMESDEGKEAVSGWLKESGFRSAEDVTGLEHKKDELLGKGAKSQADKKALNELYKKYGVIDADDLDLKLAMLEGAEAKGTEMEKLQRRLEIIEKTAKDSDARAEKEKALRADSEKRAQIISALKGADVNGDSIDVLLPYFSGQIKVDEDENGKINLIVDTDDGPSPLNTFVEAWSKTDKAKIYINAPGNSGAGSSGAGSGATGQQKTYEQINDIPDRQERLKEMAKLAANSKE